MPIIGYEASRSIFRTFLKTSRDAIMTQIDVAREGVINVYCHAGVYPASVYDNYSFRPQTDIEKEKAIFAGSDKMIHIPIEEVRQIMKKHIDENKHYNPIIPMTPIAAEVFFLALPEKKKEYVRKTLNELSICYFHIYDVAYRHKFVDNKQYFIFKKIKANQPSQYWPLAYIHTYVAYQHLANNRYSDHIINRLNQLRINWVRIGAIITDYEANRIICYETITGKKILTNHEQERKKLLDKVYSLMSVAFI